MTAKYVRIFGSNVVLLRGVRSVTVKFYELTSDDQDYLRELLTSRGQEGLIPPKVDANGGLSGNGENNGDAASAPAAEPASFDAGQGAAPSPAPRNSAPMPGGSPFPGPGSSAPMPRGGGAFPGGAGFGPTPGGGPSFPGGPGFGPPAGGSSAPMPGASPFSPPGFGGPPSQPGYSPAGPSAMPAPGSSPASGSFDRLNQNMQRHSDSMQQMQDRLNQQHDSIMNRHRSVAECLNCKRTLTEAESSRTSCPHCGVTWDYEIDEYGNKRDLNNSSFRSPFSSATNSGGNAQSIDAKSARLIGIVFGIFIGLAVVVGMIIGTIYIIMSIASASSSSQQRQYR